MSAKVGTAPSTTTIQYPNGKVVALSDWVDDRLFGTVQFNDADAGQVECFSSGRSQQIPGGKRNAQEVDTNLPRAGSNGLGKDYEMLIYGVAIKPVRAMRAPALGGDPILGDNSGFAYSDALRLRTLFQFERMTAFEFQYNEKPYCRGTIADFPAGTGYYVFATSTNFELAQNGVPSPRDRQAMVLPIHMKEGLSFVGIFKPQAPLQIAQPASDLGTVLDHMDVKVTLNGLIKRIVV